jgi:hypothetical protein
VLGSRVKKRHPSHRNLPKGERSLINLKWSNQLRTRKETKRVTRRNNTISISIHEQVNERERNKEIVVSIRDNGTGIEVSDVPLTEANSDNLM